MNQAIRPSPVPPARGLEREEPELNNEADIPSDDGGEAAGSPARSGEPPHGERPASERE